MKTLLLLITIIIFSDVKSQTSIIPIHIFENSKEIVSRDTLNFFVKKHLIPVYSSGIVPISKIIDTINILTENKIKFSVVTREMKFNNFDCYIYSQQTTIINQNCTQNLDRKLMFSYVTTQKDKKGNTILYFYSIE